MILNILTLYTVSKTDLKEIHVPNKFLEIYYNTVIMQVEPFFQIFSVVT